MRIIKYILLSIILYIEAVLTFAIPATITGAKNIVLLYRTVAIVLLFVELIVIHKMFSKNKKLLFYRGTSGIIILFITIILVRISDNFISKACIKILDQSSGYKTVYSVAVDRMGKRAYDKTFSSSQYGNINIMYKKDVEPGIEMVKEYLDYAKEDCERVIGKVPNEPLVVKLDYDETMFKDNSQLFEGFAGIYISNPQNNNRHLNILVKDAYKDIVGFTDNTRDFRNILRHEFTHYNFDMFILQNGLEYGSFPTWFKEGVSEYIGYESGIYNALPQSIIPFKELMDENGWAKYFHDGIYQQSYCMVYYLVANKGENAIRDIMIKTKDIGFDEAFKEVAGATVEQYEEKLRTYLANDWKGFKRSIPYNNINRNYFDNTRIEGLQKYIEQNPNNADALVDLATVYEKNDLKKAMETCETAVSRVPNHTLAWVHLGEYAMKLKDYNKAEAAYQKAVDLDPKNSMRYENLAQALLFIDTDKAIEVLQTGIKASEDKKYMQNMLYVYKKFQSDLENGDHYKAYLTLVKSEYVPFVYMKISLIEKALNENKQTTNKYRDELSAIKKKLEAQKTM